MSFAVVAPPAILNISNGNITLNARSGVTIAFQMENAAGAFLDIAASALFFEVGGYLRQALTPAAGDDTTQLITLLDTTVGALPINTTLPFLVRDETGTPAQVVWSGSLRTYGYVGAPP